ncbi:hypothetical protein LK996_05955 [Lysobacter sp. A6]|uniref:EF-hand domain-containing protein n=1 Tax=Noviluteimonas lactosilytica TaxID=2888523 RepID=A0ABS8JG83_9GAMM|nr:EF-hand domain-containing protein [Lysobacter lactosilyticus]MCC8362616.1 hypothetical protein [Lysobacter lactosilyticus]
MNIRNVFLIALVAASPAFAQNKPAPAQPAAAQQQGGPDAVFAQWDTDKNGTLSKNEFLVGWAALRSDMVMQRMQAEFVRQDADKSGKLEAGEFANLLIVQRLGKSAPPMSAYDANKNNGLEFPEYIEYIKGSVRLVPAAAPQAK